MIKLFAISLSTMFLLGLFAPLNAQRSNYNIDSKNSLITWTGKKLTGEHTGTLSVESGNIVMIDNNPSIAIIAVDMTSIKDTDMDNPKMAQKLAGHLNSADFFDTANHPTADIDLKNFQPLEAIDKNGNNYQVSGTLIIKGKTEKISFPASIKVKGNRVFTNGSFVFDRSKFDVRYGSKNFFADIGDKAIDDNVIVEFSIVGVSKATRD